jgi:hypothetical protein
MPQISRSELLLLFLLCFVLLFVPTGHAQKGALNKKERPVFWPAQALASDCQTYSRIYFHPDGSRLRDDETVSVTSNEIAIAMRCQFYILGWMDESLESLDGKPPRYAPRHMQLQDEKVLIDTFIKYVKDHPEQENYAASTILAISIRIVSEKTK